MHHLLEHCTSQLQTDAVEAYIKHNTNAKAATALGISTDTLKKRIRRARFHAAKAGVAPEAGMTNQTVHSI